LPPACGHRGRGSRDPARIRARRDGGREPRGDGREFHLLANVLADTGRYLQPFQYVYLGRSIPTTEKPPLYPTVLALPSWLGLDSYAAHRVVSCLLGASAIVLIGLLGRRVGGTRIGLVAAAIAAVYPALWMLDSSLRSESLYLPLIALVLLLTYARRFVWLGVALGLAALTRSEALLLVPLLLFSLPAPRLKPALAVIASCFVSLLPGWRATGSPSTSPRAYHERGRTVRRRELSFRLLHVADRHLGVLPKNDPAWGRTRRSSPGTCDSRRSTTPPSMRAAFRRSWVSGCCACGTSGIRRAPLASKPRSPTGTSAPSRRRWPRCTCSRRSLCSGRGAAPPRRAGPHPDHPDRVRVLVAALSYGSTRFRVAAEPSIVVLASVGMAAAWQRVRA